MTKGYTKPRIWKRGSMWFCSYYKNELQEESGRGFTPYLAWYIWKYRINDAT